MVKALNELRHAGIYAGAPEKYWNGIGDFRG
jgi:hypothetical protein